MLASFATSISAIRAAFIDARALNRRVNNTQYKAKKMGQKGGAEENGRRSQSIFRPAESRQFQVGAHTIKMGVGFEAFSL